MEWLSKSRLFIDYRLYCIPWNIPIVLPFVSPLFYHELYTCIHPHCWIVYVYIYIQTYLGVYNTHTYIYTRTIYVLVHWQRNFVVFWPSFLLFKSPTLATSIWAFLGLQECMHRVKQRCQRCIEARVVSSGGRWEVGLSLRQINLYGFMDLPQPWTGRK